MKQFVCSLALLMVSSSLVADPTVYRYDSLDRLIAVTYPDGSEIGYTYDANGNRLTQVASVPLPDTDGDGDGLTDDVDPFPSDPNRPGDIGTIRLRPGTNLIGHMVAVDPAHAHCMGLIAGLGGSAVIDSLARLNPDTGRFEVCSGDNDFAIEAGVAYLIEARAPVTRGLATDPACVDLVLAPGSNLRGHPNPPPGLSCFDWLADLGAGRAVSIQRFDERSGRIQTCAFTSDAATIVGIDFPIRPGGGYMIGSRAGGVSAPAACDVPR